MIRSVACPLCAKKPISGLHGLESYWYCKNCKLAWLKKFPKTTYKDVYYKPKSSVASKLFSPIGLIFYKIRVWYAGFGKKNIWIDIGAGEGGFVKTVPAKRKIGVEISASGREMMEEQGIETLTNNAFLKKRNTKADVISFWHVLEHVDTPWEYLSSAKRNLKKDGKIVIGVPNFDSFEAKLFKEYWFHLIPNYHLWHYSPKSMKKLLKQTGFKIEKIDYWSIEHHLTGVLQSFVNKTAGSDAVLHKLIKRGDDGVRFKPKDVFWSVFWLTLGLPLIVLFWITGSLTGKSGTIVIVASPKNS